MIDDGLPTPSSQEQQALEERIWREFYSDAASDLLQQGLDDLELYRNDHIDYLLNGLASLPSGFVALDASRPWICFWILHSLALLDQPLSHTNTPCPDTVADFLAACQHPHGGFGGGPQQLPHLATTYAAVAALVTIGTPQALGTINRPSLQAFLRSRCVPPEQGGGMTMHQGGEVDVRGCYTAIAAAHMAGIDTHDLASRGGLVDFVRRCQTYEGGLGGEPGNEAHGGYTYCGVATLMLLGREDVLDVPRLLHWLLFKQAAIEGGFAGRTNKLVDGCYTFWQGALVAALAPAYAQQTGPQAPPAGADTARKLAARVVLRPPPPAPEGGPAAQARAAHVRVSEGAIAVPVDAADVPPPRLVPVRADALGAGAAGHRRWLQQSALAWCDPVARAAMAAEDPASVAEAGDAPPCRGMEGVELCNTSAVQLWVLRCCQGVSGGLRDKPGKGVDYYHTCYCLSGLSAMQHYSGCAVGQRSNMLRRADLLCNVLEAKLLAAREYLLNAQL